MHLFRSKDTGSLHTRSRSSALLAVCFVVAAILPDCVLANTENYAPWTVEA